MRLISVSSRTSLMIVTALFVLIGCGSPRDNPLEMDAGTDASGGGVVKGASGGTPAQTGGGSGTGGTSAGSGGRNGTGGATSSGGSSSGGSSSDGSSSGGASTGGVGGRATTTGGAPGGMGGTIGSGGMGTGGVINTGGHGPSASGGAVGTGGVINTGGHGPSASGGAVGTGGVINTDGHGPSASGGAVGAGGLVGTGGKIGTGGTGTGGAGSGGAPADPCLNNGGCSTNATCAPTTGGRMCTCKTGYSGDGLTCTDVNECLSANGGCDANATCANTVGGRTCTCATGYTGNGLTCAAIPPPAPISVWKFEKQTNPNTILDSAGTNPGTVVTGSSVSAPPNATTPVYAADRNGVANGALRLDGVTSTNWVLIPSSSSLNAPWTNNAITVTFWVRMKTVPPSGGVILFDRGGNADPTPFELWLFNGSPYLSVKNFSIAAAAAMPTATWTFLAGVYDGTNLILYVNGNVADSFSNVGIQMMSGGEPAAIGAFRNTTGPYSTGFIDGDIDEVRLYGAALTAPQIKTVMQQ